MGIQIVIEVEDLQAAGWQVSYDAHEMCVGETHEGDPVFETLTNMVITKANARAVSYSDNAFVADCNYWGSNRGLFESWGLLDIPHKFV